MSIADRITKDTPYSGTLTEETFHAWLNTFDSVRSRFASVAPPPLILTRSTYVLVGCTGYVTVFTGLTSRVCSKEEFKEAFGVDLGTKNDYITTLGKLLPEEFWEKGKS